MSTAARRQQWVWGGLAFAAGTLAAIVDMHSDGPQLTVLFLLVLGTVFGFGMESGAWRWAVLLVLAMPLLRILNLVVVFPSPRELTGAARLFLAPLVVFFHCSSCAAGDSLRDATGLLLALIPALLGAYCGAFLKRIAPGP